MRHRIILFLICLGNYISGYSQSSIEPINDHRYLEDQFYAGITYNFLFSLPPSIKQNNFSYGLHLGFIKDFPLNFKRNISIGIGIGYAINSYYHTLRVTNNNSSLSYTAITGDTDYKRNKFESQLFELPIEFRWRSKKDIQWNKTSPESYKFWRVYTGFKLGYAFRNTSKFVTSNNKEIIKLSNFRSFHYGITASLGYNNWNFYAYYGLQGLFEEDVRTEDNDPIQMRPLRVGLIFYLL